MPKVTIAFGITLIVLGLAGYFGTGQASLTALIPSFFGVVFALVGWIATRGTPAVRKHSMHAVCVLALLGFFGPAVQGFPRLGELLAGEAERPAAVVSQIVMAILCLSFLGLCARSFMVARRSPVG
jgi:hypothetical protein